MSDGEKATDSEFCKREWRPKRDLLHDTFDHMLHKWQFLTDKVIDETRAARPDIGHRVIVLWRSIEDHLQRIIKKSDSYRGIDTSRVWDPLPQVMKSELEKLWRYAVRHRNNGLDVEIVNAGTMNYDRMDDYLFT